jgi:hypothetical protein
MLKSGVLKRSLLLPCLTALLAAASAAQTGPAGHWEGTLKVNDREIGLALDLAKNDKGEWIASFGLPAQTITGMPITGLEVAGDTVKFTVRPIPQQPSFDLKFADGKLAGSISAQQGSLPLEFKRTGEAKVERPPVSPAVSKELEGDWTGTLTIPNGELTLMVHFKNLPDKTVEATLDSPKQGAQGLALNDVKQTGTKVEFAFKAAGGSFQGNMNKEGTEIAGEWSQGGNSLPLKLKKK